MPNILSRFEEVCLENNMAKIKSMLPELMQAYHDGLIIEVPCKVSKCAVSYQGETYRVASIDFNHGKVNLNGSDTVPLNECFILWIGE